MVFETGRPARTDRYGNDSGRLGTAVGERGPDSAVGVPIVVKGRRWGLMALGATEHRLPRDVGSSWYALAGWGELAQEQAPVLVAGGEVGGVRCE
jgi:hypothetical protein